MVTLETQLINANSKERRKIRRQMRKRNKLFSNSLAMFGASLLDVIKGMRELANAFNGISNDN